MADKYLARGDAPFGDKTWKALDETMKEAAKSQLTGRRLLHIEGPYGLGLKAVPLQDTEVEPGLITSSFIPLSVVQTAFTLGKRDLAAYERDPVTLNTGPVALAAIECARLEDTLIFKGTRATPGLLTTKGSSTLKLRPWDEIGTAADDIIKAVTALDGAGFHGPYCLALAPDRHNLLYRRYPQGNVSELAHVETIVKEGVSKAPILDGGGVLLASGRQFAAIVLGQDMATGFIGPVGEKLEFSISESLALIVRAPGAICVLKE
jgi:uncharacterized linocin/CFP29 family protein